MYISTCYKTIIPPLAIFNCSFCFTKLSFFFSQTNIHLRQIWMNRRNTNGMNKKTNFFVSQWTTHIKRRKREIKNLSLCAYWQYNSEKFILTLRKKILLNSRKCLAAENIYALQISVDNKTHYRTSQTCSHKDNSFWCTIY